MIGVNIRCINFKNTMYYNMKHGWGKDIILIFIMAVVVKHIGLSCLVQSSEKFNIILIDNFHIGLKWGLGTTQQYVPIYVVLFMKSSLLLHANTYMI